MNCVDSMDIDVRGFEFLQCCHCATFQLKSRKLELFATHGEIYFNII